MCSFQVIGQSKQLELTEGNHIKKMMTPFNNDFKNLYFGEHIVKANLLKPVSLKDKKMSNDIVKEVNINLGMNPIGFIKYNKNHTNSTLLLISQRCIEGELDLYLRDKLSISFELKLFQPKEATRGPYPWKQETIIDNSKQLSIGIKRLMNKHNKFHHYIKVSLFKYYRNYTYVINNAFKYTDKYRKTGASIDCEFYYRLNNYYSIGITPPNVSLFYETYSNNQFSYWLDAPLINLKIKI